ncbi:hypothetical protein GUJ93_ZPchr0009g2401 [Zizania palustris]|uniref:Uncharacterized protein n=1 Tax=Zizania palustris TaxID=103762 RepID=A0A8J5S0Y8_ZIZPA|nr:hypothetical protein GUJ93_ZPchr0009g2401 [Zizania palustris]
MCNRSTREPFISWRNANANATHGSKKYSVCVRKLQRGLGLGRMGTNKQRAACATYVLMCRVFMHACMCACSLRCLLTLCGQAYNEQCTHNTTKTKTHYILDRVLCKSVFFPANMVHLIFG